MRYGRTCPEGFLAVYSVDTEEEARLLIASACRMDGAGNYYAPELVDDQTLETLYAFGDRLHRIQEVITCHGNSG